MQHDGGNILGSTYVVRYIEASANVALQYARFPALASLFSKKGVLATMLKRAGLLSPKEQSDFSIRTLEALLTRLMRAVKLADMKKPLHADSVINLKQSLEALLGTQMMGGNELVESRKILRLMVAANMGEDVSPTELQHAAAEITAQKQLMDGGGQGNCVVKPLLRAMLVLPAGAWLSQVVVDMAEAQAGQAAVEKAIVDLEKQKDSLPVLDMASTESIGVWKGVQANVAETKKALSDNTSLALSERLDAVQTFLEDKVQRHATVQVMAFIHHVVQQAVVCAKESRGAEKLQELLPEHRDLLLGLKDQSCFVNACRTAIFVL